MNVCSNKILVYILSVLAIVLWGMSYIWSDRLLKLGIPVEFFVFVRIFIAGLVLLVFNVLSGKNIRLHRKDFGLFVLLAMFEPLIYFVTETYGIKLTESPTYSSLVIASTPVFSVVAGVAFFKERVNLFNIFGVLICLGGLVMVTLCASSIGEYFIWGVILLIIAVFSEVGHASCTKSLTSKYLPQVIVMYQFLIGSVMLLPLFLTKGIQTFDAHLYLSWEVLEPIIALAVFCSSVAFSLWAGAIKHLGVAKSSIFLAMIPIVTAFAGYISGQENLSTLQWLGIAVSVIGLIFSQTASYKSKKKICRTEVFSGSMTEDVFSSCSEKKELVREELLR